MFKRKQKLERNWGKITVWETFESKGFQTYTPVELRLQAPGGGAIKMSTPRTRWRSYSMAPQATFVVQVGPELAHGQLLIL